METKNQIQKTETKSNRFGWLYDLRTIPIENKQFELIVTKYLFYISRKNNGIIYLLISQAFKYNNTSLSTSLYPTYLYKSNVESEIKALQTNEHFEEKSIFDVFEKYSQNVNKDLNLNSKLSNILTHLAMKIIKISSLEIENDLTDINYFFKIKDNTTLFNNKCILAKSNTYFTSTFLFQSLYSNEDTEKVLEKLNQHSDFDKNNNCLLKSRSLIRGLSSIKLKTSPIERMNSEKYQSITKSRIFHKHEVEKLKEKLKTQLNGIFVCQDMFDKSKIKVVDEKNEKVEEKSVSESNMSTINTKIDSSLKDNQMIIDNNKRISFKTTSNAYVSINKGRGIGNIIEKEEWAELENKSFYSGDIKNKYPNGFGKEYRCDGLIYDGMFMNGKWHGVGVITNENLDSNTAEYINGRLCGI